MSVTLKVNPEQSIEWAGNFYVPICDFNQARLCLGHLEDAPGFDPERVQQVSVVCIADPAYRFMIQTPNGNCWRWTGRACDEELMERRWRNLRNGNTDNVYISSYQNKGLTLTNYRWADGNRTRRLNYDSGIYYMHFSRV